MKPRELLSVALDECAVADFVGVRRAARADIKFGRREVLERYRFIGRAGFDINFRARLINSARDVRDVREIEHIAVFKAEDNVLAVALAVEEGIVAVAAVEHIVAFIAPERESLPAPP